MAMRSAVRLQSDLDTALLGALAGVSALFSWASLRGLGAEASPAALLLLALLGGPPLGLLALLLLAVPLRAAGVWLGGRGSAAAVRAALAWSAAPLVVGLPLWIAQLALAPAASFGGPGQPPAVALAATALRALHAALWLWAALLSAVGLGEAQRTGPLRGALTWLLAGLIVVAGGVAVLAGAGLIIQLRQG